MDAYGDLDTSSMGRIDVANVYESAIEEVAAVVGTASTWRSADGRRRVGTGGGGISSGDGVGPRGACLRFLVAPELEPEAVG
jgi:hypothetical protein